MSRLCRNSTAFYAAYAKEGRLDVLMPLMQSRAILRHIGASVYTYPVNILAYVIFGKQAIAVYYKPLTSGSHL